MVNQPITPTFPVGPETIYGMTLEERIKLLLTTTAVEDIAELEGLYKHCLNKQPVFRLALYEVARQNARYRHTLAPGELGPHPTIGGMGMSESLEVLKTTNDTRFIDAIETWTEGRLKKLPDFREGLFEIARLAVEYRLASEQQKSADSVTS